MAHSVPSSVVSGAQNGSSKQYAEGQFSKSNLADAIFHKERITSGVKQS